MDAATYAKGLREFADWIEENGDELGYRLDRNLSFLIATGREDLAKFIRLVRPDDDKIGAKYYEAHRFFGPIDVQLYAAKEDVCTEQVVGQIDDVRWTLDPEILAMANEEAAL